jgi:SAM-dependent methyltransferase
MHQSVLDFVARTLTPEDVHGKSVLEVGSANVNGSVRPQIEAMGPSSYLGIDLAPGSGVDRAVPGGVEDFQARESAPFDLVISCEMLEHAERWEKAFRAMAKLVAPGGRLILTARGPGFPFHNPPDHWRFTPSDLWRASVLCGLWPWRCESDPQAAGVFLRADRYYGDDAGPLQPHATNLLAGFPSVLAVADQSKPRRRP